VHEGVDGAVVGKGVRLLEDARKGTRRMLFLLVLTLERLIESQEGGN
jgi:hypothetical protein